MEQKKLKDIRIRHFDLMIAEKEQELDRYQEFRTNLYETLCEELINRDEYEKMHLKYTRCIEETQTVLMKLRRQRKEALSDCAVDTNWIAQFSRFNGLTKLTREAVVSLIDRITVFEDKQIKIDFNYRDEIAYYQKILEQVQEVN